MICIRSLVAVGAAALALSACADPAAELYPLCVSSFDEERAQFRQFGLGDRHSSYARKGCACVRDDVVPLLSSQDRQLAEEFFTNARSLRSMSDSQVIAFEGAMSQISGCLNDALREEGLMEALRRRTS